MKPARPTPLTWYDKGTLGGGANDPRARVRCLRRVARALDDAGLLWAVRGAPGEPLRWCRARSAKDLDLWAPQRHSDAVITAMVRCGGIPTCARGGIVGRPGVLSAMFIFLDDEGRAIGTLDVSFGPPRAGVVEVGDEAAHARHIARPAGLPCFEGPAVLTELILRRCVRGKPFDAGQVRYARRIWQALPEAERASFREQVGARFGRSAAELLSRSLTEDDTSFRWQQLRGLLLRGVVQGRPGLLVEYAVDKAFFNRRPRQRERYPGGSRPSGTTIAIVGTDGTGKSSLVEGLTARLRNFGLGTESLYFGRVRSSTLISDSTRQWVERTLRVSSLADSTPGAKQRAAPREKKLRYLASYVYVVDYGARLLFRVLPLWARGTIVVIDRYVYDLHLMPHGSPLASRLAELISPRPGLMFFLDIDPQVILSRRQERTLPEVLKQQALLRSACGRVGAWTRYMRVQSVAPTRELASHLTRAAVATAHRREIGVPNVLALLLDDVQRQLCPEPPAKERGLPMPAAAAPSDA